MKRMMMMVALAVAGIAAADSDVDALKAVLEKVKQDAGKSKKRRLEKNW